MRDNLMDDDELILAVIDSFLTESPPLMEMLKDAFDREDVAESERHSHSVKGAALSVGGTKLGEVAEHMEARVRAGEFAAAKEKIPELMIQFNALIAALKSEVSLLSSDS